MDDNQTQQQTKLQQKALTALGKIIKQEIDEENPYRLKMDCTTALESFFLIAGILMLFFFITGIVIALQENEFWPVTWGMLILSLVFFVCRRLTDNYYVLDKQEQLVCMHRSFAGIQTESPVCEFSGVFAVMPVAKMVSSKSGTYWMYHLAILLRSGRFIRLSDASTIVEPELFTEPGKEIAAWLGVPFIPGRVKEQVKISGKPVENESCIEYITEKQLRKQNLKLVLIIVAVSVGIPVLIVLTILR